MPLKGRPPLIDHVLDRLTVAGITKAVVNVHHHADALEAASRAAQARHHHFGRARQSARHGGGVVRALPLLGDGPFLIHNSDSVWIEGVGSNIARMIAAWDPERMDSLMLLANGVTSLGYDGRGDFMMDAGGALSRRPEHKDAPFVFTGVSIAHPRMFEGAPQGQLSLNKLWDKAIDAATSTECGSTARGCTSARPKRSPKQSGG